MLQARAFCGNERPARRSLFGFRSAVRFKILDQVKSISKGITLDRFDYSRLVIEKHDGDTFRSANVNPKVFQERFLAIRKFIR